ncbi:putative quinol monooxygenase [Salidesulfovibrio onnuriiensis]|uniref:putative quinol monooxygenase n=1 Tax=Salidesulfovibrio onnuriiensis TaxID=2583823 RepID=UPI00164EEBEE|nr:putative quinol monooxygenase [Salidesulfovibrio onnuriiensis]
MVCVHVFFTARKGREAQARERLTWLMECSRKDPGCIRYDMHVSPDDPGRFMLFELWESQELLDAHGKSDHLEQFGRELPEYLVGAPEVTLWDPF